MTLYRHSTDYCFEDKIGPNGLRKSQFDALLSQLTPAYKALSSGGNKAASPLMDMAARTSDLAAIESLGAGLRQQFNTVVVAGSGGSGLSGKTLTRLAVPSSPVFHYLENVDPDAMDEVLAQIELKTTCFLIISKSGSTVETLSQFYVLLDQVKNALGTDAIRERFIIITMPGESPLRIAAKEHGLRVLDHPSDIGGRFAVLTAVGLLPAAIAGLDINAVRRGAQSVVDGLKKSSPAECAPAIGAAIQYGFSQKNYPINVMLPYGERLTVFASWYRQCWAESLGKNGKGTTPVCSVGTTDQHSQLQLYLGGPRDKLFHLLLLKRAGTGKPIKAPALAELDYLQHKTLGDVMQAEQQATLETLARHQCPLRVFALDDLKEEQMGALLMHFMLEIILAASLMEVDPFDQPAVEEGKMLARDYLLKGDA